MLLEYTLACWRLYIRYVPKYLIRRLRLQHQPRRSLCPMSSDNFWAAPKELKFHNTGWTVHVSLFQHSKLEVRGVMLLPSKANLSENSGRILIFEVNQGMQKACQFVRDWPDLGLQSSFVWQPPRLTTVCRRVHDPHAWKRISAAVQKNGGYIRWVYFIVLYAWLPNQNYTQ